MAPRDFDSEDTRATRPQGWALRFVENVDCPRCDYLFEGVFHDTTGAEAVEDMTDPPAGEHTCPACGFRFATQATGWSMFGEAG